MSSLPNRERFESAYTGKPPWVIGKPQRAFVEVADRVEGEVLDAGCGTSENALFFAGRGHHVLGIDFFEAPIREARRISISHPPTARGRDCLIVFHPLPRSFRRPGPKGVLILADLHERRGLPVILDVFIQGTTDL